MVEHVAAPRTDEPSAQASRPELTAPVLAAALRGGGSLGPDADVVAVRAVPAGTGQLADSYRVALEYRPGGSGPASLFAKLTSADPDSARTASRISAYDREWRFYRDVAPLVDTRTPRCHGAVVLEDRLCGVLLADLTPDPAPSDGPASVVTDALAELPALQAVFWDDPGAAGGGWLYDRTGAGLPGLRDRYHESWALHGDAVGAGLTPDQVRVVRRFGERCAEWAAAITGPGCLIHQDLRTDNLVTHRGVTHLVDWQTLGWGSPAWDPAFLVGSSLPADERRRVERGLIERHVDRLAALGVQGWNVETAWAAHRHMTFALLLAMVPAMAHVRATPRGFAMFAQLIERAATHVLDLDALDLLDA